MATFPGLQAPWTYLSVTTSIKLISPFYIYILSFGSGVSRFHLSDMPKQPNNQMKMGRMSKTTGQFWEGRAEHFRLKKLKGTMLEQRWISLKSKSSTEREK